MRRWENTCVTFCFMVYTFFLCGRLRYSAFRMSLPELRKELAIAPHTHKILVAASLNSFLRFRTPQVSRRSSQVNKITNTKSENAFGTNLKKVGPNFENRRTPNKPNKEIPMYHVRASFYLLTSTQLIWLSWIVRTRFRRQTASKHTFTYLDCVKPHVRLKRLVITIVRFRIVDNMFLKQFVLIVQVVVF